MGLCLPLQPRPQGIQRCRWVNGCCDMPSWWMGEQCCGTWRSKTLLLYQWLKLSMSQWLTLPKKVYGCAPLWPWTQAFSEVPGPLTLHLDNQSAIALTWDHQYHAHTKHIDIRFHVIRWIVEDGKMKLVYCHCPTEEMVTDIVTNLFMMSVTISSLRPYLALRWSISLLHWD